MHPPVKGAHGVSSAGVVASDGLPVVQPCNGELLLSRMPFKVPSDQVAHLAERGLVLGFCAEGEDGRGGVDGAAGPPEVDRAVGLCPLDFHRSVWHCRCPLLERSAQLCQMTGSLLGRDDGFGKAGRHGRHPEPITPVRCSATTTTTAVPISATSQTGGPLRRAGSGSFSESVGMRVLSVDVAAGGERRAGGGGGRGGGGGGEEGRGRGGGGGGGAEPGRGREPA